jgi:hypothetical protein
MGLVPDVNSDRGLAPDVNRDRGLVPDVNRDRGLVPDVNRDRGLAPDVNRDRGLVPDVSSDRVPDVNRDRRLKFLTSTETGDSGKEHVGIDDWFLRPAVSFARHVVDGGRVHEVRIWPVPHLFDAHELACADHVFPRGGWLVAVHQGRVGELVQAFWWVRITAREKLQALVRICFNTNIETIM